MMSRKRYSIQFQDQACRLVSEENYSTKEAAVKLGIHEWTLKNWLKKRGLIGVSPVIEPDYAASDDPVVLKARIADLERQLKKASTVNEILKKATAYFANPNP